MHGEVCFIIEGKDSMDSLLMFLATLAIMGMFGSVPTIAQTDDQLMISKETALHVLEKGQRSVVEFCSVGGSMARARKIITQGGTEGCQSATKRTHYLFRRGLAGYESPASDAPCVHYIWVAIRPYPYSYDREKGLVDPGLQGVPVVDLAKYRVYFCEESA